MANSFYSKGKENLLGGNIDWDGANVALIFIDENDDVPDLANDYALANILVAARIAISPNFGSKTITNGVADAADVTVTGVTGDVFESLSIFMNSGTETTAWLICNIDTATGLPCTPNGGDITVVWDNGANRIFSL